jgi:hypothetical protein
LGMASLMHISLTRRGMAKEQSRSVQQLWDLDHIERGGIERALEAGRSPWPRCRRRYASRPRSPPGIAGTAATAAIACPHIAHTVRRARTRAAPRPGVDPNIPYSWYHLLFGQSLWCASSRVHFRLFGILTETLLAQEQLERWYLHHSASDLAAVVYSADRKNHSSRRAETANGWDSHAVRIERIERRIFFARR